MNRWVSLNQTHQQTNTNYTNSVVRVRERTIPTERPSLIGDDSANFFEDRVVSSSQRGASPTAVISVS
jgi:hypothetical protein